MLKKITAALTALVLLLSIAAGCSGDDASSSGVTLRTMTMLGDPDNLEIYSSLLCDFTAEHDDIYLQDTTTAETDAFKLGATLSDTYESGSAPHVVYYYNNTGIEDLSEYFVPVDEIRKDFPDFASGLSDSLLESLAAPDRHTYCLPTVGQCTALAVNKWRVGKIFDDGVSWESFMYAIENAAAANIVPIADPPDSCDNVIRWLVSCLGESDACTAGLSGDTDTLGKYWTPALEQYVSLCTSRAFAPAAFTDVIGEYVSDSDVIDYGAILGTRDIALALDPLDIFASDKAAMMLIGSSDAASLDPDNCRILPLPIPDSNDSCVLGCFDRGFYITRKAYSNPVIREVAVAFVDYMIGADASAAFAGSGSVPANADAEPSDPLLAQMADAIHNADRCILFPGEVGTQQQWEIVRQYAAQLYYGIITPEQMITLLSDHTLTTGDIVIPPEEAQVTPSDAPSDAPGI